MSKRILYRSLAFLALFAIGAAFVFIVGTYRFIGVETYPFEDAQGSYSDTLAVLGDRAARDCDIASDSELFLDSGFDVEQMTAWLEEHRPEKLVIFFECPSSRELGDRLDSMSLLVSRAVGYADTVYLMAAPPPLEAECTFTFRPMYVRQNNHALEKIARHYGAVYIEDHTLELADTTGAVAPEYEGSDSYFSPDGAQLVRDSLNKYL